MTNYITHEKSLRICIFVLLIGHHHAPIEVRTSAGIHALPIGTNRGDLIEQLIRPTGNDASSHEVAIVAIDVAAAVSGGLVSGEFDAAGSGTKMVGIVGGFPCLRVDSLQ